VSCLGFGSILVVLGPRSVLFVLLPTRLPPTSSNSHSLSLSLPLFGSTTVRHYISPLILGCIFLVLLVRSSSPRRRRRPCSSTCLVYRFFLCRLSLVSIRLFLFLLLRLLFLLLFPFRLLPLLLLLVFFFSSSHHDLRIRADILLLLIHRVLL